MLNFPEESTSRSTLPRHPDFHKSALKAERGINIMHKDYQWNTLTYHLTIALFSRENDFWAVPKLIEVSTKKEELTFTEKTVIYLKMVHGSNKSHLQVNKSI